MSNTEFNTVQTELPAEQGFNAQEFWDQAVTPHRQPILVHFIKWKVMTDESGNVINKFVRVIIPENLAEKTKQIKGFYGIGTYLEVIECSMNPETRKVEKTPKLLKVESFTLRNQILQFKGMEVRIERTGTGRDTNYEVHPVK